nr:MAG TPA: hypothetical protein [Caudoviricetes sp.]
MCFCPLIQTSEIFSPLDLYSTRHISSSRSYLLDEVLRMNVCE